ncbi:GNAT family N-acetyltransferase [Haliovirga abyssi]|uniref:N-acetyltransferase domain-containing protein n=1 Tax=Haliovirga abyssi TaxID=2996794 RepID=A0AAU9DFX4_9FUSO|nr:GNAT family N-acetyltransferase [Haliovirga abyssi]BDU50302.1 hypothetical protein HLVA_08710 [Haliovirga abyssi]
MQKFKKICEKEIGDFIKKIKNTDKNLEEFRMDNCEYFLFFEDDNPIAYAIIGKESDEYFLYDFFVKKEERFRNVGTNFMKNIFEELSKNNVDEFYLKSWGNNKYFFLRNGFIEENGKIFIKDLMMSKKRQKEGMFGTIVSIVVNIFLSILKIMFGIIGKSHGLIADGIHSFSDVITSVVILFTLKIASKPADNEHPYGHGQAESIAGNMVGVILIITAVQLIIENIKYLVVGKDKTVPEGITIIIVVIAIIIKFILYKYKMNMAIKLNNDAILADAKDHKSDVISSIGVLVGILLAIKFSPIFDILTGILVAILIGREGIEVVIHTSNKIMDEQEKKFISSIEEIVENTAKVYNIHNIFMKRSGDKVYLAFHMRVNENMSVTESHFIVDEVMIKIKNKYKFVEDIIIHVDPLREKI